MSGLGASQLVAQVLSLPDAELGALAREVRNEQAKRRDVRRVWFCMEVRCVACWSPRGSVPWKKNLRSGGEHKDSGSWCLACQWAARRLNTHRVKDMESDDLRVRVVSLAKQHRPPSQKVAKAVKPKKSMKARAVKAARAGK